MTVHTAAEKAYILSEALPYIQRFAGTRSRIFAFSAASACAAVRASTVTLSATDSQTWPAARNPCTRLSGAERIAVIAGGIALIVLQQQGRGENNRRIRP